MLSLAVMQISIRTKTSLIDHFPGSNSHQIAEKLYQKSVNQEKCDRSFIGNAFRAAIKAIKLGSTMTTPYRITDQVVIIARDVMETSVPFQLLPLRFIINNVKQHHTMNSGLKWLML